MTTRGPGLSARTDALPEHHAYRDSGCEYHPACLTCPFERCRFDVPGRTAPALARAARAATLRDEGATVEEIAAALGCARRSVFRFLQSPTAGPER